MATLLLNKGQISLVKDDIKPLCFIKCILYGKIDMKYPFKNRKVGKKLDFDPKNKESPY